MRGEGGRESRGEEKGCVIENSATKRARCLSKKTVMKLCKVVLGEEIVWEGKIRWEERGDKTRPGPGQDQWLLP